MSEHHAAPHLVGLPVSDLPAGALFLPRGQRCTRCGLPGTHCICAALPSVRCRTKILVIRHCTERFKSTNTGALTAKVLGAQWVDHGLPGQPLDLTGLLGPCPRVLLPHGPTELERPPSVLVVPDGSWQQVRSMRARIAPLATVPLISLPQGEARPRMRLPHLPEGRSTMEAVADALDLLGEPEPARVLRELFSELARRWIQLGQAPDRSRRR